MRDSTSLLVSVLASLKDGRSLSEYRYRQLFRLVYRLISGDEALDANVETFYQVLDDMIVHEPDVVRAFPNAFDYGAAWGASAMLAQSQRNERVNKENEQRRVLVERYFAIFAFIHANEGCNQTAIMRGLGEQRSNISHKLSRIDAAGHLLVVLPAGRSKRYWLDDIGLRLFQEVRDARKAQVAERKRAIEEELKVYRRNLDVAQGYSGRMSTGGPAVIKNGVMVKRLAYRYRPTNAVKNDDGPLYGKTAVMRFYEQHKQGGRRKGKNAHNGGGLHPLGQRERMDATIKEIKYAAERPA